MTKVVSVRFRTGGKSYYFDPQQFNIFAGEDLIVETARGIEFGNAVSDVKLVDDTDIVPPLKPVIRIADDKDRMVHEAMQKKRDSAMKICLNELPEELDINNDHKASCWMNVKQVYDEAAATKEAEDK